MQLRRSSGILLHPTSLPGSPGIGTLGAAAYRFVDWLAEARQTLWQILPLGPTGYGDSPYASFSTFAGNPLLIDLETLVSEGLLSLDECIPPSSLIESISVDFGAVVHWKNPLLRVAAKQFARSGLSPEYRAFVKEHEFWLEDYALFRDIKRFYDDKAAQEGLQGKLWNNYWPKDLASRDQKALREWKAAHTEGIEEERIIQFFFFRQWRSLKTYANSKNISIIGDIPIFVAADSADVWANQSLFQLHSDGTPRRVAGVPPDYFSETGQLWGNPLYDWKAMKRDDYAWWKRRIVSTLSLVDYVRIDHFRGFESYWSVPSADKTAINGEWIKGPDHDFFKAIRKSLGDVPIIAEDLGVITDEVRALRDDFGLPGMRVLQFAFDANEAGKNGFVNSFLPHMYESHTIVYTGTHDNDTMQGWLDGAAAPEKEMIRSYLGGKTPDSAMVAELLRLAMMSVAVFAVFPLQDIYAIGSEGRMNAPSTLGANWSWRMSESHFDRDKASWLASLSRLYARNLLV